MEGQLSAAVVPSVEVFFDLPASGGEFFTIGDPVKGQLDGSFELIGADGEPADVGAHVYSVTVRRGRSFELDDFQAGTVSVLLRNYDGRFLPEELDTDDREPYGADGVRPGRRCRISVEGITVFDGTVEDWNFRYDRDGRVDAELIAEDALAALARTSFTEWTTTQQVSGARVAAVLDRPEVGFGANRDIDDGASTMQSDLVTHGSSVLNYLNLIAESDLGRLFVSRDGVVTFRDRLTVAGAASSLTFGSGRLPVALTTEGGDDLLLESGDTLSALDSVETVGTPIAGLAVEYGSEVLHTRVTVDRVGGIAQTRNDNAAQDAYGVRTLSLTELLLTSDEQSDGMAAFLLNAYATPRFRFRQVVVNLDTLTPSERADVLALDLGSVVTVVWKPVGMDAAVQQTLAVEGISISATVDDLATVTLDLAPRLQESVFVVEDDTFGALDGVGVLSY